MAMKNDIIVFLTDESLRLLMRLSECRWGLANWVRASDCQCQSRSSPGSNPSIWGTVHEALLKKVDKKIHNIPLLRITSSDEILKAPPRQLNYNVTEVSYFLFFLLPGSMVLEGRWPGRYPPEGSNFRSSINQEIFYKSMQKVSGESCLSSTSHVQSRPKSGLGKLQQCGTNSTYIANRIFVISYWQKM